MRFSRSRLIIVTLVVALAVIAGLLWRPFQEGVAVASLQSKLPPRSLSIFPRGHSFLSAPPSNDASWAEKALCWYFGGDKWGRTHADRFKSLLHGPMETLWLAGAHLPEDALADVPRFRELREITVTEHAMSGRMVISEAEWTRLCTTIRSMPTLERIELTGRNISDASLAPLAGHPKLKHIQLLDYGNLTAGCAQTFLSMPELVHIRLRFKTDAHRRSIRVALPGIHVE